MLIQAEDLDADATYRLLSGIIVPRPIAWTTSISSSGVVNLAPFSCFTFVSSRPPMLGISISRRNGVRKDTSSNIVETGEFVVHIGNSTNVNQIHISSAEHAPNVNEAELLGMSTVPGSVVKVPRLSEVPIAMECRLESVIPFGELNAEFFVGRVLAFHIEKGLAENGKVNTKLLDPLGRIGGPNYTKLGEIIHT